MYGRLLNAVRVVQNELLETDDDVKGGLVDLKGIIKITEAKMFF